MLIRLIRKLADIDDSLFYTLSEENYRKGNFYVRSVSAQRTLDFEDFEVCPDVDVIPPDIECLEKEKIYKLISKWGVLFYCNCPESLAFQNLTVISNPDDITFIFRTEFIKKAAKELNIELIKVPDNSIVC